MQRETSTGSSVSTLNRSRQRVLVMAAAVAAASLTSLLVPQQASASSWTGTTSQDWNNGANWDANPPTGNYFINTGSTNFAILTADSAFTPTDLVLGDGTANSGRLDQRAGTLSLGNYSATGFWMFVGRGGGSGTYNLADTSVTGAGITGYGLGSGNLNVGKLWVGGSAFFNGGTGVVNINTSGTVTANSTQDYGYTLAAVSTGYGAGSSGTINLENGTLQCNSEMWVGFSGTGVINQTGGTSNATGPLIIGFQAGSNGTYNLNGGAMNASGGILMGLATTAYGTLDLNGGTLTTTRISTGGANSVINFNGGVLKPTATNTTDFMTTNATYNVRNGGAIIDTSGFDVLVGQPLLHSSIVGDNAVDGGLTKNGAGAMTMTAASTYTGPTNINAGTLILSGSGAIASSSVVNLNAGAFSGRGSVTGLKVADAPTNILANTSGSTLTSGTLTFQGDAAANITIDPSTPLVPGVAVTGALATQTVDPTGIVTINASSTTGLWANGYNNLIGFGSKNFDLTDFTLSLSGTLGGRQVNGGLVINGNYLAVNIVGDTIYWAGTGNNNWATGLSNSNWKKTSNNGATDYLEGDTVSFLDGASNTAIDLGTNVNPGNMTFNNSATTYSISSASGKGIGGLGSLTKTGTGKLTISTVNSYTGGTNVNLGTLALSGSGNLGAATASVSVGGGLLDLGGTSQTTGAVTITAPAANGDSIANGNLTASSVTINSASNVIVSASLLGTGGLTKAGAGIATLSGANTYSGTTNINGGTLVFPATFAGGALNVGGIGGTGAMTVGPANNLSFSGVTSIGYRTGVGTLNITGGTFSTGNDFRVGGSDVNGSSINAQGNVNISGGNVTLSSLTVARGNWVDNAVSGTLNLSGGTVTSTNDVIVGFAGSGLGKLAISGTGVLNIGPAATKWMIVGEWDTAHAQIDISGGTLNLMNNTSMKFNTGNTTGANVVTQTGGVVSFYSDAGTTLGGTGNLDLQQNGQAASNNTYNLNGGLLRVPAIVSTRTTGTRAFNFNGGTLQATGASSNFINLGTGSASVNVRNAGAIIDTNGYDVTIPAPLAHSNVSGDAATDGGLTKTGAGVLNLSSSNNTYTGATTITAGIVRLPSRSASPVARYSFDNVRDTSNNPVTSGSLNDSYVVVNDGSGGAAMNGTVNNNDNVLGAGTPGGSIAAGKFGNAMSLDGLGSSVDVASKIVDQSSSGSWTLSLWLKTSTSGSAFVGKNAGTSSWATGHQDYYLASNPPSATAGSLPTGVQNGGGFLQGNQSVTDDAWHMVTFVDQAGTKAVYVDGVSLALTQTAMTGTDTSTFTRLGYNIDTLASLDGNVNFAGLMDEVQFYNIGLSQTQITELFNANAVSTLPASVQVLPTGTAVNITASGAMLDVNGNDQIIGSLAGVGGSTVSMAAGNLTTGGNNTSTTFAGVITGTGSVTKTGTGTMTFTGANSYTGGTNVTGGTLVANKLSNGTLTIGAAGKAKVSAKGTPNSASGTTVVPALSIATGGQLDLTNNSFVIDYTGAVGTLVADTRASLLAGRITTSLADSAHRMGYADNATLGKTTFGGVTVDASSILVKYTYGGDANLDGQVDVTDLGALATNWQTASIWTGGDFDYSGFVDVTDLGILATNWQAGVGSPLGPGSFDAALASVGLGGVSVPEPAAIGTIGLCLAAAATSRRRARKL